MTTAPSGGGSSSSEPGGFNRWWVVSAILLGAIVAMLAWLLLFPAPAKPPTARPAAPAGPPGQASACGLPAATPVPPATPPTGTHWRLVGTMAAPYDPRTTGPADASHGAVGTCYAPDPLGALYAAYNFVAATSSPALRSAAAQYLCAAGPGRDAALADLAAGDLGSQSTGVQLVGFTFTGYTPGQRADLDLAVTTGHGGYAHFPLVLLWQGDWKVQLPPIGSPYATATTLPTTAGYALWAGA